MVFFFWYCFLCSATCVAIVQLTQTFRNMLHAEMTVLTPAEIDVIFCCVPDLHKAHDAFVTVLQPLVESWTDNTEVAEPIKVLVSCSNKIQTNYYNTQARLPQRWLI
jgi:hypothetical protein